MNQLHLIYAISNQPSKGLAINGGVRDDVFRKFELNYWKTIS